MGCDIYVHLEHYNKESKRWENLSLYKKDTDGTFKSVDVYDGRDYELFGILAGVRSCSNPFIYPRGLPDDLSCEVLNKYGDGEYFHTPTWYDYCELYAYENMMKDSYKKIKWRDNKIKELEKQIKNISKFIPRDKETDFFDYMNVLKALWIVFATFCMLMIFGILNLVRLDWSCGLITK